MSADKKETDANKRPQDSRPRPPSWIHFDRRTSLLLPRKAERLPPRQEDEENDPDDPNSSD
ncbi:hypothetical protein H7X87_04145 [Acetobacteraceae bacterium]|nr:hypothetical protein [Candidatus Parcubacteria bacterium]